MGYMMVVPDNRGTLYSLDDRFTSNGNWVRYRDGFGHMVWGGHFNNFLNRDGDIVGLIVWFFNMDSLVDSVNFFLDFDNRGSNRLGAFKSSGHSNFEVRDGGFQDLCSISGNVLSLSQVNFFGDDGCGFVEGSNVGLFINGDMGGRKGDNSGFVSNIGSGLRDSGSNFGTDSGSGRDDGLSTMGSASGGESTGNGSCVRGDNTGSVSYRVGQMGGMRQSYGAGRQDCGSGGSNSAGKQGRNNNQWVHGDCVFYFSRSISNTSCGN
jgi:hypothetical protein